MIARERDVTGVALERCDQGLSGVVPDLDGLII